MCVGLNDYKSNSHQSIVHVVSTKAERMSTDMRLRFFHLYRAVTVGI
jgi:hypothetical protein